MDPRYRRSREKLRTAIYALATERPVAELSVVELCRAAAVTRDTFYRHSTSPLALLASLLGEEVAEITAQPLPSGGETPGGPAVMWEAEVRLLNHVAARAAIYRNALTPQWPAELRANLEGALRNALQQHVEENPSILPSAVAADDAAGIRVLAAYAASGTVGAIEAWLQASGTGTPDVERGARLVLAASPEWWLDSRSSERLSGRDG